MLDPGGPDERVKLLDFGIAKLLEEEAQTRLTKTGAIIGTPTYMSPEQALGHAVDARTDLYSAGVILYELLAARVPFDGPNPMAVLSHHITEPPTPLRGLSTPIVVPRDVEHIVLSALAKKPDDRMASAEEFRRALAAVGTDVAGPRTRSVGVLVGILGSAIGLVGIGVAVLGGGGAERETVTPASAPPSPSYSRSVVVPEPVESRAPPRPSNPEAGTELPEPPRAQTELPGLAEEPSAPTVDDSAPEPTSKSAAPKTRPPRSRKPQRVSDAAIRGGVHAAAERCREHVGPVDVELKIALSVAADGRISSVRVLKPYTSTSLGRCIARALPDKTLPAAHSGRDFQGKVEVRSQSR